jgi:hypothetical protein
MFNAALDRVDFPGGFDLTVFVESVERTASGDERCYTKQH